MQLHPNLRLSAGNGIPDYFNRAVIIGHRPVDEIDRMCINLFTKLLKSDNRDDVFKPVLVAGVECVPVEFFFNVDGQQDALAKALGEACKTGRDLRIDH